MKYFNDCTLDQKVERWENVVRVLRALSPHERKKHFDMWRFVEKTPCGTVACAVGHCAFDPWFKRRGFAIDRSTIGDHALDGGPFMKNGLYIGMAANLFFGEDGTRKIFFNQTRRPVGQVIREVCGYIKELKTS